jgi:hypothetical protein
MTFNAGWYAAELRRELGERARAWSRGRAHQESSGGLPVIVFSPEEELGGALRHGNFFTEAYRAIESRPEWKRRLEKIHAHGRALPKAESGRRWRELDSSMSSDALLMNVFCSAGASSLGQALGIDGDLSTELFAEPVFGWKARVPLASGRLDRTEVDMRWGSLLVEAKLTESDFQTRAVRIVEAYRDFDKVFDRDLLPRTELRATRRRRAVEFAEDFTQEWEDTSEDPTPARDFQQAIVARARQAEPAEAGYLGYQLIRNVLAAYAERLSFALLHDERRPDLGQAWFQVMAAVKSAEMRTRCKVMTWQELAGLLTEDLQVFLDLKYGIVRPGRKPSLSEDPGC